MHIEVRTGDVLAEAGGVAILLCSESTSRPGPLGDLYDDTDFSGKPNQSLLLHRTGNAGPRRVLLVGLGPDDAIDPERLRQAAATAVRQVRTLQIGRAALSLAAPLPFDAERAGELVAEGLLLGNYRYLRHRTNLSDADRFEIDGIDVVSDEAEAMSQGVATGSAVAEGVIYARDLVNRPGDQKTPPLLADEAVTLGQRTGLSITIFDKERLEAEGFGGILAVGKGSDSDPRFIIMEHGADLEGVPTVCLVGKGLTFDSGGLNIKPADGMESMKNDMGGSAAVFGAMLVAARLQLPVHLVGLVPSAENMPSGRSYRPGDIITTLAGTTVEILNTDAEGRVILADGLHYAQRYEPDAIVEFSTLTGAVIVALGNIAAGLMATDQSLADALAAAGDASGDRVWQLPLWDEYMEITKSEIADLKNLVGVPAGSIGAGAFLANFVGDRPFAHVDIAGTGWIAAPKKPYQHPGATGSGVRLAIQYLRTLTS